MNRTRHRQRRDRGSVAVEIAVVYPVVLLLILAAVQFGVWWHASHVAHAVADAGLAAARADGATEQQAEQAAVGLLGQLGGDQLLGDVTVQVDRNDLQATVTVEGTAVQVVPGLSLPVSVELSGPTDRFTPSG
jgi:Flp pilus assembly protein TadG